MLDKRRPSPQQTLPRDTEFVLGMLGGMIGILSSCFYVYIANPSQSGWVLHVFIPQLSALLASIIGWKAAYKVQYETKRAGITFLICSLVAFVTLPVLESLTALLFLIAGSLCLLRKNPQGEE